MHVESWLVGTRRHGDNCVRNETVEKGRDGATAYLYCSVDHGDGAHQIRQLLPGEVGRGRLVGIIRHGTAPATERLDVHWDAIHNETVHFGAQGLLARSSQRACYAPDEPCNAPWIETRYAFDDQGNLVSRETAGLSFRQSDRLEIQTNERGDWIAWHFSGQSDEQQVSKRAIYYRD